MYLCVYLHLFVECNSVKPIWLPPRHKPKYSKFHFDVHLSQTIASHHFFSKQVSHWKCTQSKSRIHNDTIKYFSSHFRHASSQQPILIWLVTDAARWCFFSSFQNRSVSRVWLFLSSIIEWVEYFLFWCSFKRSNNWTNVSLSVLCVDVCARICASTKGWAGYFGSHRRLGCTMHNCAAASDRLQ